MAYLVVAFPELDRDDFEQIQNYRKKHDQLHYLLIKPHLTLVFPLSGISQQEFVSEIKARAQDFQKFRFVLRTATISKDAFKDHFHIFLLPEEGSSRIIRLHDKLYSGKLKEHLRLDLDYMPHIGIGNSKDSLTVKKMVDEWNSKDFEMQGSVSRLTILNYENNTITKIEEIELQ
jgi:hypothetical protein